jgi:hypothetical protein
VDGIGAVVPSLFHLFPDVDDDGEKAMFIIDTTLLSFHVMYSTWPLEVITDLCSPLYRVFSFEVLSSAFS